MCSNFSFNAPTYFDFNPQIINENDNTVEKYFEVDHECVSPRMTCNCDPLAIDVIDKCICSAKNLTLIEDTHDQDSGISQKSLETNFSDTMDDSNVDYQFTMARAEIYLESSDDKSKMPVNLRKSLSTGNLINLEEFQPGKSLKSGSNLNVSTMKPYTFKRPMSISKERINQLAQPKQITNNYVSTAEQVNKFFHTKLNKPESMCKQSKTRRCTRPKSPALETKHRYRDTHIMSTEEREKLEIEEYKKLHMKPLPLNPKIFQGPMKPLHSYKKPATVVIPFNLTKSKAKPIQNHAELTKPISQAVRTSNVSVPLKPLRTQPRPFSFESRDKELAIRHQQKRNQALEEEKKAREFRANPPPKFVGTIKKCSSLNSLKSNRSEDDSKEAPKLFKAKPPSVLWKKPFEPKKSERPLVEVTEFCLNSERRARDREEYDKTVQEKLDRLAMEKALRAEQQARYEKEEITKLRKEIVHTAQPIKQYKEVKIEPCGKVTVPVTPNFKTAKRLNSYNKENSFA